MVTCGSFAPAQIVLIGSSAKGAGRQVVLTKIGIMNTPIRKPDDIQWCGECGRYYNPKSEHECISRKVKDNQRSLERWLGRFKIREDG